MLTADFIPAKHVMADLPPETLQQCEPFQAAGVDLFGPLSVKGIGGQQRKTFKVWGVMFVCLATKAVAIWLAGGYDTASYMLAHQKQIAVYGTPHLLVSDRGSQLVAAAGEIVNWNQLQHDTAADGTVWRFVPPEAPWRNGLVERSMARYGKEDSNSEDQHRTTVKLPAARKSFLASISNPK